MRQNGLKKARLDSRRVLLAFVAATGGERCVWGFGYRGKWRRKTVGATRGGRDERNDGSEVRTRGRGSDARHHGCDGQPRGGRREVRRDRTRRGGRVPPRVRGPVSPPEGGAAAVPRAECRKRDFGGGDGRHPARGSRARSCDGRPDRGAYRPPRRGRCRRERRTGRGDDRLHGAPAGPYTARGGRLLRRG